MSLLRLASSSLERGRGTHLGVVYKGRGWFGTTRVVIFERDGGGLRAVWPCLTLGCWDSRSGSWMWHVGGFRRGWEVPGIRVGRQRSGWVQWAWGAYLGCSSSSSAFGTSPPFPLLLVRVRSRLRRFRGGHGACRGCRGGVGGCRR